MAVVDEEWVAARVGEAAALPAAEQDPSIVRLRALLERCAAHFAHLAPGGIPSALRPPRRGLHPDEASAFLRTVDRGLAVVDEAGFVTLTCVRPKTPPGRYALLSRGQAGPYVNLEYLIQIGAAGELAATYGWPADRLDFERGEFDILGFDRQDRVVLAVEAKARVTGQDSLEKLLLAWLQYNDANGQAPATNAGRKYLALRRLCESEPVTVWLVAAGARWPLQATWTPNGIDLTTHEPPSYDGLAGAGSDQRAVLWSRPYDPALHGHKGRGASGRCSWFCDAPAVWSTRVREVGGSESTFALCETHHRRVENVYRQ
ncbi:hypothetical protein [Actinoallomurus rhizosphaericola]|uniref:hypothetical protein n=1 Tax=Actinoallomurus rhizosphaericola TaxID=2952536 RepID=UPI0020927934|nr:hypothetical protein [Actinoallomurus rhizosphaericola]MCO5999823.1 hypothetical protein [Actinoallomurus rhizosphaericola]